MIRRALDHFRSPDDEPNGVVRSGEIAQLRKHQATDVEDFMRWYTDPEIARLLQSEPLDAWKEWLAFHTLNQQANVLPKPFRDASFAFSSSAPRFSSSCATELAPRAERSSRTLVGVRGS
mgnify:CR=1 FL=1